MKVSASGLSVEEIHFRLGRMDGVVKLNSNENPLGPSKLAIAAYRDTAAAIHLYPPSPCRELIGSLARKHRVAAHRIVLTAGSLELLDLLLRLQVGSNPGGSVLAAAPCFPALVHRTTVNRLTLRQVPVKPDFSLSLSRLEQAVTPSTRLIYLANPDNPSGQALPAQALADLAGRIPESTLLVVDEAYADYADKPDVVSMLDLELIPANVAVIRTFSKGYGLAGLRVGYGVLSPALTARVQGLQLNFSISRPAQLAALAALQDQDHLDNTVRLMRTGRVWLLHALHRLDCDPTPSQAGHVMFRPPLPASRLFQDLLNQGVVVRLLDYAGLPERLRVSVGTLEENTIFHRALESALR